MSTRPNCFKKKDKCESCPYKDDCDNYRRNKRYDPWHPYNPPEPYKPYKVTWCGCMR